MLAVAFMTSDDFAQAMTFDGPIAFLRYARPAGAMRGDLPAPALFSLAHASGG
jgi:hypothetical protein